MLSCTIGGALSASLMLSPTVANAQQSADTLRRNEQGDKCTPKENIYRLGRGVYTDTLRRADFRARASDVAELDDCDTTLQTFVLVRRPSPWRVGAYVGPNFAYCGTWDATFGNNRRDNTLYNGTGFNITLNTDYFLSRPERRLRFGIGAAFGYQNYRTRRDYIDFLRTRASQLGIPNTAEVQIRQRSSEDFFFTLGPVLQWTFARSRRNPSCTSFLELSPKIGIYRTEAALLAASVPSLNDRLVRMVSPSNRLNHFGGNLSLGVFFPLRNTWHVGVQAQGFYTGLNYFIVDGVADQLLSYYRKHGGFNAGLAVRKGFQQKKLIPKAPVSCPTCDSVPVVTVRFANQTPLGGLSYVGDSTAANSLPSISWRSRTVNPKNETFTARLYYRPDSVAAGSPASDQIIAEVVNTTDTTLAFPSTYVDEAGRARRGFYYVTVHNRQTAKCGTCMSEVATTSFALLKPNFTPQAPCEFRHKLERLEVFYRNPYTRDIASVCYCNGEVISVGEKTTRLRFSGLNRRLAIDPYTFDSTALVLNFSQLPGPLAQQLQEEKRKIESGQGIRYKGRRVRPQVQYFRAVFSAEQLPCNGQEGRPVGSFNVIVSDNTYSITDLKPLSPEQYQKLTAPAAPQPSRRRR
ncbi:PorT family protein [Rudanella lutea]|uniref:PorT family protein n=1 Tax=Rudanella lutea TaxID=451374 RepID=UPI001FE240D5|nr:PorT family protein [Rudanella lutea]